MINHTAQKQLLFLMWGTSAIGIIAMVLIVGAAYHAHRLLDRERASLDVRRQDDLALVDRGEQIRAEREQAGRQLQSLSESLADLTKRVPSSPKEAEFLAQLSAIAGRSSVRLKNFRPGQVTAAGSVNTCDMHLSLVGSFAGICTLLDGLAQVPRLLCVPRLTLTGPQSAGDACVADLTISLCFAPPSQKQ